MTTVGRHLQIHQCGAIDRRPSRRLIFLAWNRSDLRVQLQETIPGADPRVPHGGRASVPRCGVVGGALPIYEREDKQRTMRAVSGGVCRPAVSSGQGLVEPERSISVGHRRRLLLFREVNTSPGLRELYRQRIGVPCWLLVPAGRNAKCRSQRGAPSWETTVYHCRLEAGYGRVDSDRFASDHDTAQLAEPACTVLSRRRAATVNEAGRIPTRVSCWQCRPQSDSGTTLDGETVLLNLETGRYYTLNRVGTAIWKPARNLSLQPFTPPVRAVRCPPGDCR